MSTTLGVSIISLSIFCEDLRSLPLLPVECGDMTEDSNKTGVVFGLKECRELRQRLLYRTLTKKVSRFAATSLIALQLKEVKSRAKEVEIGQSGSHSTQALSILAALAGCFPSCATGKAVMKQTQLQEEQGLENFSGSYDM